MTHVKRKRIPITPPPPHIKVILTLSMIIYCINMHFVLLICVIQNDVIDGLTLFMTTIGTTKTKQLKQPFVVQIQNCNDYET